MKLFIQSIRDKFIDNCISVKNKDLIIEGGSVNKDIYRIHHNNQYSHYLFVDILLDNEIIQFINDNHTKVKFFIYHFLQKQNNKIIQVVGNKATQIIDIPTLYNPDTYRNEGQEKIYDIVAFLDNRNIPETLNDYLYPKKKLPIRLFNNSDVKHPQNLGLLSEKNKQDILNKAKYCIILNNEDYVIESKLCNCVPISIDEISDLKGEKYSKILPQKGKTYEDFIFENII
jgi:hypothetical protein